MTMCMPVGKCMRRLAMCLGWSGKCLRGRLNACAGRQMSGRLAMCMRGRQSACAVGNVPELVGKVPVRLAMCLCGRKNDWAVGKVPTPVGKVPARSAMCMRGW